MNFCVHLDIGTEIHGYFVPDGFSVAPSIHVRINDDPEVTEVFTWVFVEGARNQGFHATGKVGFILTDDNVPGISAAPKVELSDPDSGLIFYRRALSGEFIAKKVLRVETSYLPSSEIDLSVKEHFQFFEHRVERYGFETIRQMLEINQPSAYVSGRVLVKNFRLYIDYNIDLTMISLRDPFYELAVRMLIFSRHARKKISFISPRDEILFKPVIHWLAEINLSDEDTVKKAIRHASRDIVSLLCSPFTQQLVGASPSDKATLGDVSRALDTLSQFTLFDSGRSTTPYADKVAMLIGLPPGSVQMKPQLEPVHVLADLLRTIVKAEHILEADLILYHFIQKAEERALYN